MELEVNNDNYLDLSGRTEPLPDAHVVLPDDQVAVLKDLLKDLLTLSGPYTDALKRSIYYKTPDLNNKILGAYTNSRRLAEELPDISVLTSDQYRLLHAALGMITESVEFLETLVKSMAPGAPPLDVVNLMEELGDQVWYQAIPMRIFKLSFDQIKQANIEKLRARYPDKFDAGKATNRDLAKEREVLEQHMSKAEDVK